MKVYFIISLLLAIISTSPLRAQKRSLLAHSFVPDMQKGTVIQFLENLNTHSGVVIEYASNSIEGTRTVTLDGSESSVGAVLQKVLQGQHARLLEKNKKLILVKSASLIDTDALVPFYTFYGFVRAANSREPMAGATIIDPITRRGIATNPYGFFSITLPEGRHRIEISHVGYTPEVLDVVLKKNTRAEITLDLHQETLVMQPVIVPSGNLLMKTSGNRIDHRKGENYNYLLGENDPLRNTYLLPGVQHIPSSFSGLFVRGGGPEENLFLMDGNLVYNPTHMLGALSIINQTSVKSMQLFKSDFPSKYSGAISSVIDIHTKDGNMEKWQGEANAGTLSGSFTIEGPVVKDHTAIMASFRHSWKSPILTTFNKGLDPNFYDAHFKVTQLINKNNKLMASFYSGRDILSKTISNTENLNKWGNLIGSLSWNKVISSRSFINTSINMSRYHNLGAYKYTLFEEDNDDDEDNDIELESGSVGTFTSTAQYNIKSQAEIFLNHKTKLNAGIELGHTIIKPFETKFSEEIDDNEDNYHTFEPLPFDELSAYGEAEMRIGSKFFIRPGLHVSAYRFKNYEHLSFQPRIFASYKLATHHQIFSSFSRMTQYLHLVTNPYLNTNADIWVPSTSKLLPEQSDSYNLGYRFDHSGGWKFSVEGYWKELRNVTNYVEGKSYFVNDENWEQNVSSGKGWAYGTEWTIQKSGGKLSFLATYTLAWSWRQFEGINEGAKFPYKYDRRHSLNAGIGYQINKRIDCSALWSFSTGDVFSMPDYLYPDFDNTRQITNPADLLKDYRFIYHYSKYNQYRTSPYHRLDAAINYRTNSSKNNRFLVTAGVYNIYGSPDQYIYEMKGTLKSKSMIAENSFASFGMTPYLSVTYKF